MIPTNVYRLRPWVCVVLTQRHNGKEIGASYLIDARLLPVGCVHVGPAIKCPQQRVPACRSMVKRHGQASGGSQQPFADQIKRQAEPIRSQLAGRFDLPRSASNSAATHQVTTSGVTPAAAIS
jgi:hypothetical protein